MSLPVFLSVTYPHRPEQEALVSGVMEAVAQNGMTPRPLARDHWSFHRPLVPIRRMMRACCGTIVIAMARTKIYDAVDYVDSGRAERYGDRHLPTEWTQIEAAIAFELDHPILVFREERVHPAGLLDPSQGGLAVWTFSLGASGTEDLQTIVRRLPDFRRKVEMFARRRGR